VQNYSAFQAVARGLFRRAKALQVQLILTLNLQLHVAASEVRVHFSLSLVKLCIPMAGAERQDWTSANVQFQVKSELTLLSQERIIC
jgi:hypothetical protein